MLLNFLRKKIDDFNFHQHFSVSFFLYEKNININFSYTKNGKDLKGDGLQRRT